MKKLRIVLTVALTMAAALLLSGCAKKTIDINDYVEITFEGNSGEGTASAYFNFEKLISENSDIFKDGSVARSEFKNAVVKLDKTDNLYEGDVIKVSWPGFSTNAIEKAYKVVILKDERTFKVSGLGEGMTVNYDNMPPVDIFTTLKLDFSGYSGKGTAYIDWSTVNSDYYNFVIVDEATLYGKLSNGDVITVQAVPAFETESEMYSGYVALGGKPTTLTKEYTVSGLPEAKEYDGSNAFTVEFAGVSGAGTAKITQNTADESYGKWSFVLDKSEGLSNGDLIVVSFDITGYDSMTAFEEANLKDNGVAFTYTEWRIMVEGLEQPVIDVPDSESGVDVILAPYKGLTLKVEPIPVSDEQVDLKLQVVMADYLTDGAEITDELVSANTEFSSVAELRASVLEELERESRVNAVADAKTKIVEQVVNESEYTGDFEAEYEAYLDYYRAYQDALYQSYYGMSGADFYYSQVGLSPEDYEYTLQVEARYHVKYTYCMKKIAEVENIVVNPVDYNSVAEEIFIEGYGLESIDDAIEAVGYEAFNLTVTENATNKLAEEFIIANAVIE